MSSYIRKPCWIRSVAALLALGCAVLSLGILLMNAPAANALGGSSAWFMPLFVLAVSLEGISDDRLFVCFPHSQATGVTAASIWSLTPNEKQSSVRASVVRQRWFRAPPIGLIPLFRMPNAATSRQLP